MCKDNNIIKNQIGQNMLFYGEMRFKQLTLLLAWLTIAGAGIAQFGPKIIIGSIQLRLLLAVSSMLVVSVLWLMEISSTLYWVANREAYPELWPSPPKTKPEKLVNILNATNAVLVFYIILYWFWFCCAYQWGLSLIFTIIGIILGVILFIYSIIRYIHIWTYKETDRSK